MCAPFSCCEECVQVTRLLSIVFSILCGVCSVCCMSLNFPVSLCVAGRCVYCVPPFSPVRLS